MTSVKIPLKDLCPNPFRDLKRLPAKPSKVAILKQSIKDTSFWDNIVVRKASNGSYEIAYGHNRLEALRQLKWPEVDLPVRNLDDTMMAKMMARENHEEWGATADVDMETVRSVVEAFGAGKITLQPVKLEQGSHKVRIAPSFSPVNQKLSENLESFFYTAKTLAVFLDWKEAKVESALNTLAFAETDTGKKVILDDLKPWQAETVARETRRAEKESNNPTVAVKVGNKLADEFREGLPAIKGKRKQKLTTASAKYRANELMREAKVRLHTENQKAKQDKLNLQKEDRQVAIFLDACKAYESAIRAVTKAISKFSPEAKAFTIRRLSLISSAQAELKGALK